MDIVKNYIVFDIGGTAVKWSVIDEIGSILTSGKIEIAPTIEMFFERLIERVNISKSEYNVAGIAISAPGAVDSKTGVIGGASALPYIHGPNFKEILKKATGLEVEIENDANCAALGECWLGSASDNQDCAFVVCGTGIGGALIKNRQLHVGINKHGGEFGCCIVDFDPNDEIKFKTWSTVGSTVALARNVSKRLNREVSGIEVFDLANAGNEVALEEIDRYYYYMAIGIYNIQYNYDPEVIVLGGAISEREEYIDQINQHIDVIMKENTNGKIKPIIKRCQKGNDANKLGALYNFLQYH